MSAASHTAQSNANSHFMDEALHDAFRFDNGEMTLRESLEFFQALLDTDLIHAMPGHIQKRVRYVRSMGMLRGDGGIASSIDVAGELESLSQPELATMQPADLDLAIQSTLDATNVLTIDTPMTYASATAGAVAAPAVEDAAVSYGDFEVPPTAADDAEAAVTLLWRWGNVG